MLIHEKGLDYPWYIIINWLQNKQNCILITSIANINNITISNPMITSNYGLICSIWYIFLSLPSSSSTDLKKITIASFHFQQIKIIGEITYVSLWKLKASQTTKYIGSLRLIYHKHHHTYILLPSCSSVLNHHWSLIL